MNNKYNECPYCGCDTFVVTEKASGHIYMHYNFSGGVADDNSGLYDGVRSKPLETVRCSACHKKVGTLEDYEERMYSDE